MWRRTSYSKLKTSLSKTEFFFHGKKAHAYTQTGEGKKKRKEKKKANKQKNSAPLTKKKPNTLMTVLSSVRPIF